MKRATIKTTYTYTCSICGAAVSEENVVTVSIPRTFNHGEEGYVNGTTEWHVCDHQGYNGCMLKLIRKMDELAKGQDFY